MPEHLKAATVHDAAACLESELAFSRDNAVYAASAGHRDAEPDAVAAVVRLYFAEAECFECRFYLVCSAESAVLAGSMCCSSCD